MNAQPPKSPFVGTANARRSHINFGTAAARKRILKPSSEALQDVSETIDALSGQSIGVLSTDSCTHSCVYVRYPSG